MKKSIIYIIAIILISLLNVPAHAADEGWKVVKIFDGDTIGVAKVDTGFLCLRLADIDAPEKDQPGGAESTAELRQLLKGGVVHFMPVDRDRYGRTVAIIYAGNEKINADMVRDGQAWVYTRYNTDPALPPLEAAAKAAGRGLWAESDPVPPWEWRRKRPHHQLSRVP